MTKTARRLLPVLLLAVSGSSVANERADRLDRFIGQFANLAMFDGTVLVDVAGDVIYRQSFGFAQHEFKIAHGPDTRFRIASVSKAMTDAAIARMIEGEKLSLDTRLSSFLPQFPSATEITIEHLLRHASGIPHTNDQPWGDGSESLSHDEILRRLAALPLDFPPGSDASYSNGGYAVLAHIIGTLTDGDYAAGMQATVFNPIGMSATGHLPDSRAPVPMLATGYEPGSVPGERRHARFYAVETRPGGGSLYSTADDLLQFARAIFRNDFISGELRRTVMGADAERFLSQGRSPGFVAKLFVDSKQDVIVISLGNNYAVPAGWTQAIANLATGAAASDPWPSIEPADPTISAHDPRLGRFRSSFGGILFEHQRSARGHLVSISDGKGPQTALIPLADGDYLQPQFFQKCGQDSSTRVITCRMLSGDERYTSVLTPLPDSD